MRKSTLLKLKNDIMDNSIRELKYLANGIENARKYNGLESRMVNVRIQGIISDIDLVKKELLKSINILR